MQGGVFLSLGSSEGWRARFLRRGLDLMEERGACRLARVSSLYETEPVGPGGAPWYLNLAAEVATDLSPEVLLRRCQAVELLFGRGRRRRPGPRTLDIDIVLFRREAFRGPSLEIPHPRMHLRRFVLAPLAEIAPCALHPRLGLTVLELLERCGDRHTVRKASPLEHFSTGA